MGERFADVDMLGVDDSARIFEHGYQSWSPTGAYLIGNRPPRPVDDEHSLRGYRGRRWAPPGTYQGEGLLAVQTPKDGPVHLFAVDDPSVSVPTIRAVADGDRLKVSADGPVLSTVDHGPGGLEGALDRWTEALAARLSVPRVRAAPTVWCSWYGYFDRFTQQDLVAELRAMDRLDLPVEVVQVDDSYQAAIGDWLLPAPGFTGVDEMARRIRGHGRRAGIWTAPFLAVESSQVVRDHHDWWVGDCDAGRHWSERLRVLDVTKPAAADHLVETFSRLAAAGYDYFKLDFLYAGELPGLRQQDCSTIDAYSHGIELIRGAVGDDALIVGCGAPLLPSLGLFPIMRVGPDVDPLWDSRSGDAASPGTRNALRTTAARQFQHGRWWVNDPDCLIVRPEVQHREVWADHVRRTEGLVASGDPLDSLDGWGLDQLRRLLRPSGHLPHPWILPAERIGTAD